MRLETIHPKELGPTEIARWRAHQRASASLASPYLTPEWAQIVGAVRADARVCVIGEGAGFLGAQRLSRFTAMGLGAPISDYQGVVGEQGLALDGAALCRALKVGRIDFTHVPAEQALLPETAHSEGSWLAQPGGGRKLYEAALRLQRSEFVRQTDKKLRKLTRDIGEVTFSAHGSRQDFETLTAWKRAQLAHTGQPPIWDTPWVRKCLDACFNARAAEFSGVLFAMRVRGELAAANFCLRSEGCLHMWVIGHDERYEAYSPGVQLARWVIGWAGDNGVGEVDFGPGDYRYKRQLATTQRTLRWGVVCGHSWSGAVRRAQYAARARIEKLPAPKLASLPGKAMRRRDLVRALAA